MFSDRFVAGSERYSDYYDHVPAPLLRKSFTLSRVPEKAAFTVCGLGFYEFYLNGERLTKGALAPYINNPNDFLYYDSYDLTGKLRQGENVIGLMLGNGMFNSFSATAFGFDRVPWRGPVRAAFSLEADGEILFEADGTVKTAPSLVTFDEYRIGTFYDARLEIPGWCEPGFDDSGWAPAIPVGSPGGEPRICRADPVDVIRELPVREIRHYDELYLYSEVPYRHRFTAPRKDSLVRDVYVYDFGENNAGVCRLKIRGERGQRVRLIYGELKSGGLPNIANINPGKQNQRHYMDYPIADVYTLKGGEEEIFVPPFTYHGFSYVVVEGITPEQATDGLLTYLVMSSAMRERGDFECSDETVNALYAMVKRSDRANYFYIPTDCPHREKCGWTADAAVSAEHMLQHMDAAETMKEWMRNVAKAQRADGALPGIVPTGGWGFTWGNGPGWDSVAVWYPYYCFKYDGDTEVIRECRDLILNYFRYIAGRRDGRGLVAVGLGDWLQPLVHAEGHLAPLAVTDSITVYDMAKKADHLFRATDDGEAAQIADILAREMRAAIREHLVDFDTMTVEGHCQTAQAMAIDSGVFDADEIPAAFEKLLEFVHGFDDHLMTGCLGVRRLFHVLCDYGQTDLALKMITRRDPPSYGYWLEEGATSLFEAFIMPEGIKNSLNHHFLGDIASIFTERIAGLRVNPLVRDRLEFLIAPDFPASVEHASARFDLKEGTVSVSWKREGGGAILTVGAPPEAHGTIRSGPFVFEDGSRERRLAPGSYKLVPGK